MSIQEEYFNEFLTYLESSCKSIEKDYFQTPVAKELEQAPTERVYRERVYCYELYHQLRINIKSDFPYTLCGELDKSGHPIIRNNSKPDFIAHVLGSMENNLLIMEVKSITNIKEKIKNLTNDYNKMSCFLNKANYYRGIMLIYGSINNESNLDKKTTDEIEKNQDDRIITMWHSNLNTLQKINYKGTNK